MKKPFFYIRITLMALLIVFKKHLKCSTLKKNPRGGHFLFFLSYFFFSFNFFLAFGHWGFLRFFPSGTRLGFVAR